MAIRYESDTRDASPPVTRLMSKPKLRAPAAQRYAAGVTRYFAPVARLP
jgi:hypothetical protein